MDDFITFNVALDYISFNKETDMNMKAIKLIDLYLNGEIDLYIELNGKDGKLSFPYSPLPQAYNSLDNLLSLIESGKKEDALKDVSGLAKKGWDTNSSRELEKLVSSAVRDTYYTRVEDGDQVSYKPNEFIKKTFVSGARGAAKQQTNQSYTSECSYFSEDETYKLQGVFKVHLDEGRCLLERYKKILFYDESDDELSERGINLPAGGISRLVSLDGQILTLYSTYICKGDDGRQKKMHEHPHIIFPDINSFLVSRNQVLAIDKESSAIVKRPNATQRNQSIHRQIVDAALYELAHNYKGCLKNGVPMASKVVEAFTLNHKVHWPDGCGVDKETGRVKEVPLSKEKMDRIVRALIKKKN
ncbi:hypothetical protein [Pseudoalteromonas sp. SCQQ13]|uniref:hypothetical protein n=1 Tax=Pseudoalteromonas sp. SCQQ13 TaxID=2792066 RepID=UPI0018CE0D8A|nr:hypothetical protein [Pseudoalteromonas sp. SCQQ13]MBH0092851.1 hypothetical protein [Pseudoalteromonas sp. SCQQ13]